MTIDWSKAPEYAKHWCPKINMFHTDAALCEECIPRPQKPAVERGRWKVGDVVQTGPSSLRHKVEWTNGDDVLISEIGRPYEVELTKWDLIMPARTKEQRQRDEAVREAAHAIEMKNGSPITLYLKYCEDLYDAGFLRAGPKDV